MDLQFAVLTEALHALFTPVRLHHGVSPHVELQVGAPYKTLHAFVTRGVPIQLFHF